MGLLDQLWDETVAGPRPDSGLGRLRKYSSFSPSSSSSSSSSSSFQAPAPAAAAAAPAPAVTRSITIARPPSLSVDASPRAETYSSSVPSSPASTLNLCMQTRMHLVDTVCLSLTLCCCWRVWCSYHPQDRRLEEVPPENQGLRWAGARRRAQEPHRVRLGGDQFVGPLS